MASIISFILAHQSDAANPELLHWIKERLDSIFVTGPWVVVAIMGIIIVSIPVFIIVVYLMQSKRRAAVAPVDQDMQEQERVQ